MEQIEQWLLIHRAVTIKHTHRNGNKVADFLANIGIDSGKTLHVGALSTIANTHQLQDFNDLVQKESANVEETHPDAGVNSSI